MSKTADDTKHRIRRMARVTAPSEGHDTVVALFRLLYRLARVRERGNRKCRIVGPEGESAAIPESVLDALARVTEILSRGDAFAVVSISEELTTQQAADILNVSRQYLVRLLDEGRIPCTRTGKHRRVFVSDLIAFKRERDRSRRAALDELTRLSEDAGGYSELE